MIIDHTQPQYRQAQTHFSSRRQDSVDSLNLTALNLDELREQRPSQSSRAFANYAAQPPRPDSRNSPALSYQRAPLLGTSNQSNAAMASYDSPDSNQSDSSFPNSFNRPQDYHQSTGQYAADGVYYDADPYAYASTSAQPYGGQYQGYTEDPAYGGVQENNSNPPHTLVPLSTRQYYDPASSDPNMGQYYPQTQQLDHGGSPQYGYYAAAPPAAQSQAGLYPDQYGQPMGYGVPAQSGYYPEYAGGVPLDIPRAGSAPNANYSGSGGANPPPLIRNRTTASTKSVATATDRDRSQPITKQAVDEYRNRIKSDPDPETQFNFSRFLIEAARRLAVATQQGSVDDAKSVKKYRDSLLQEALKLIKRLATQGTPAYADAQFFLANCLGHGALGLAVDHEKAYNLYVQASKQNHPAATFRTAVCNEVGAGTRRDAQRAVLFYRKASALGDTAGMYKLGMILLNGLLGHPKNPREAVAWLKKAAAQADEENPHALHELGILYEKPQEFTQNGQPVSGAVMRDEAQARELFTQAAQLGHPPSQYKLGSCYEYGSLTCPVDPRRSIAWYTVCKILGEVGNSV